jgi:hypothetical protein
MELFIFVFISVLANMKLSISPDRTLITIQIILIMKHIDFKQDGNDKNCPIKLP